MPRPLPGFGDAARAVREERGLSLREAGRLGGLDASSVLKIENGDSVGYLTVIKWARGFKLDSSEWLRKAGFGEAAVALVTEQRENEDAQVPEEIDPSRRVTRDAELDLLAEAYDGARRTLPPSERDRLAEIINVYTRTANREAGLED